MITNMVLLSVSWIFLLCIPGLIHGRHVMVEMRDGVRLATRIVKPRRGLSNTTAAVLVRSPYGPPSEMLAEVFTHRLGYVSVMQDQRGAFMSEGNFSMWMKDAEDGYDTMEWISKQSWSNGTVFSAGISADGCGAYTQALTRPPWLRGQLLMLASPDAHKTIYPGGVFREGLIVGWMSTMSAMTRGYSLTHTLPDILQHKALSGWYDNVEANGHLKQIDWPTVQYAGWWDIFAPEQIDAFNRLVELNPNKHRIVIGNLGHCVFFNLFDHRHAGTEEMKGVRLLMDLAAERFSGDTQGPAHSATKTFTFYVSRGMAGFWASMDRLPKVELPMTLRLSDMQNLTNSTTYVHDPRNPVPTVGQSNLMIAMVGDKCGPADQTHGPEKHPNIISYETAPLDHDLYIVGRTTAEFRIRSNITDADVFISITDVSEESSTLVSYGIQSMKWRHSERYPEPPMVPGEYYPVSIELSYNAHVIPAGHRVRINVYGSSHPYYTLATEPFECTLDIHASTVYLPRVNKADIQMHTIEI